MRNEPNDLLAHIHIKLLRFLTDNRLVSSETWQHYLRKTFTDRYEDECAMKHYERYADLSTQDKVRLYEICKVDIDAFYCSFWDCMR